MRTPIVTGAAAAVLTAAITADVIRAAQPAGRGGAIEKRVPAGSASLYAREIGRGQPIIVLHGGPDFDHRYLLPDLDRLQDVARLIYYDQRGRGKSAQNVRAEDVTLASDVEDVDRVRQHFGLDAPALLGHSWGAVVALEYALRHPSRVSHLILMNPAPVSSADFRILRQFYLAKIGTDMDRQRAILESPGYKAGDPEVVAARYRIHFKPAVKRSEDYERLMVTMKAGFVSQGKDGILKARAVEDRLMRDSWELESYDLKPRARALNIPTLIIAGDSDFIPPQVADNIARAIPKSTLVTMQNCGHFAYLECAGDVRKALSDFFRASRGQGGR